MAEADVKVAPSCNDVPSNLSDVGAQAKTPQTKFAVLKTLIEASDRGNVEVSDRDIVDTVFNLLVGGEFDLEVNFIIQDENCIIYMLDIMSVCSMQCQAEIWSKFKGICRKSYRNLQACVDVGLTQKLLTILPDACEIMSELIVDMLSILTSYNITVKELKQLLSMLKGEHGRWPSHATKLLGVLQATTERQGPDCFFSFPGRQDAAIALPPLKTWPYANGFTFTTWFRMDPLNSLRSDMDKPYLYCFRNSKGMGYSGHFVGNCFIVTVLKAKGKGFQHCLKFEFKPRKWYMVTIVHIYNRWRTSEVKCYANGQLVSYSEMNWSIGGNDQYDRCFLGSAETGDDSRVFCGQMTASYVFSEALSASQVYALHQLGPAYKNQFKFPTESDHLLVNHHRKVLYDDNKLSDAIVLSYNPKSTDGQLCLESSPRSHTKDSTDSQRWFVHNPHALMLHDVRAVVTHSIHSALHSVGGAEVLFPLFAQLDYKQSDGSLETTVCATLLNFFLQLLQGSVKTQQQVLQGKGFLVIGTLLERAHKDHISMDVLTALITMAKFLDQLPNSVPLMRQFCDHILFNPALWIYTKTKIQICLYTFLATEFVSSPTIQTNLRRVSTVILLIHALKYYYWVVNPQNRSGIVPKGLAGPRPSAEEILSLRAFILLFLKQLVTRTGSIADDELQSILGYLLTMHEDDNILDVLQLLVAMLSEHGTMVTPVFDKQNGLAVVYKLLGSRSVLVRIHTLKLLAYFLKQCSEKRKSEIMESQSLFMLIGERLLLYPDEIDIPTYNAMYEILVENPCTQVLQKPHQEPSPTTFIQNPAMMKVTANMFRQCPSSSTLEVKLVFLNDLVSLFQANAENRRTLLQQSVWQDWMLSLGYLRPRGSEEYKCQELVYQLFRILLYHSIKLEWGGWRVWVDTLAIVHSKVSYEEHKAYLEQMYDEYKKSEQHRKETGHVSAITGMQKTTHTKPTVPSQELAIEASDSQGDASEMAPIGAGEVLTISEAKYGDEDHLVVTVNDHDEQPASEDQAKDSKSASANEESSEKEDDSVNEKLDARSNAKEDIGDHPVMTEDGETPNDKDTGVDDEKVPEDVDQVTGQETEQQNEDGGVTASNKDETETQSDTGEVVEEDRITKVATEDQEKIDVGDENIHKEDPVKDEDTVKDAVETNTAGDLAEQTQDLEDEDKIDVGDENIHKDPVKDEDTSKDAVETNTAGELAEQTQDLADEDKSVAEECTKSDEKEAETEPDVGDVVSEKEAEEGNDLIKNADDENHTEEKSDEEEKINENQHEKAEESVHENEVVQKDENSPDYKEIEKVHVKEDEFEKEVVDSRNESDEEDIKAEGDETRDAAVEKEVKGFEDKSLNASTKDEDDVSIEASHGSTPSAGDIAGGSAEEIPKHAEKEKDGSDSSQEDQVSDTVGPDGVVLEDVKAEGAVPTKDADKATNSQNAIQEATQESSKDADAAAISPSGSTQVEKNDAKNQSTEEPRQQFSPGPRTVVFRVPEFKWSDVHLRLLDDLFARLEEDIESWRSTKKPFVDVVNGSENVIFLHNTLHLFSQMIDNIILACGGILPILSSATSQNYELDCIESSHGLSMESAWNILNRLSAFVDVVAFASNVNFADIEADKNMQSGGLLRQCLRAACLCAVRNCLESRYLRRNASVPSTPNVVNTTQEVGASNGVSEADEDEDENADVLAVDAAKVLLSFMSNKATPILDPLTLLQDADVGRLKAIIYRDMDDTTSSQYIALSVVYFVSVLMVSKYRDLLDPDSLKKLQQATVARRLSPRRRMIDRGARFPSKSKPADDFEDAVPMATDTMTNGHASPDKKVDVAIEKPADIQNTEVSLDSEKPTSSSVQVASVPSTYHSFDRSVVVKSKNDEEATGSQLPSTIASSSTPLPSSTEVQEEALGAVTNGDIDHTDLPTFDPSTVNILEDNEADISSRLERSMDELAPLLRDIFLDFSSYLSKTLVGSHGQELLVEGLVCMRSYTSVVELVMLLCSQEWQTSIQKNAGLAFIELINEGRLLCHGMKDHVVKVANEADFILSKQRAEDVKKHAHFESSSAIYFAQQRDEQRQCDALISAAKHRDHAAAQALKNRITNILTNKLGAWGSTFNSRSHEYWMLDAWEDDTRRRRRFVRNPYGSSHKDAVLAVSKDLNPVLDAATPGTIPKSPSSFSVQGIDQYQPTDEELSQEEIDLDELQGPVSFSTEADLIAPGASLHGVFSISSDEFFFEVVEQHPGFAKVNPKVLAYTDGVHGKWLFQEVRGVYSRRYLLNNSALEIFLANRTCVMFNFADNETMKKVVAYLPAVGIGTGYGLSQERRVSLVSPRQLLRSSNMTERWQRREISNFEYLMFLNTIAGRTFNDLNQYPVFPWVLSNYDVAELDLSLPSNYRDLSKPVGALNPKRAAYFQSRYENWDDPSIPKFHYGTHYSNAAFTLGWLVRVEPFTTMFLALQGGKFDHADRTFHSVLQSWKNCQRDSHDVKELIPEFFYLPEMFINSNNYNLGATSEGIKINDVILPPWAKSADDFVQMNRLALESEIVSCQIHQWIDLIFGFKQRGPEATRATNVFYHLTYENSVNLDKIKDPVERAGIREQIKNFGQTPSQLLVAPHPPRSSAMHMTPMMFKENEVQDVIMVLKFLSNSPVMCVAANTHANLQTPAVVTCTKNLQFCVNKWNEVPDTKPSSTSGGEETSQPLPIEPDPQIKTSGGACKRQISDLLDQSVKVQSSCFVVTADNRFLATCGYWDRSFRVTHMDSGRLNQVVFGHWDVVTCLTRSDTYIGGDCYFVSGSRDATLMLWYWSGRRNLIIGDSTSADENPSPRAVLTGHDTEITCAAVCAEVGLIASGSLEGPILLHTITGDLLRSLEPSHPSSDDVVSTPRPELIEFTGEGMVIASYDNGLICNFTMNGRSMKSKVVEDNVRAMLSSKNSQFLVTGGDKGIMQVWSAWDFKLLYTYPQCDAGIRDIALSHDEKVVITGMTSGSIVAFRINFNKWHHEYQDKY